MLRLTYFQTPGYAEASRLALTLGGLEFEDRRVDWDGFKELRDSGAMPWGLLPILETDEGTIAESRAILTHSGRLAGLEPENLYTRAKVEEAVDVINDISGTMSHTWPLEGEAKVAARRELVAPDGALRKVLNRIDAHMAGREWMADTNGPSIADLRAFTAIFQLASGHYDGIEASLFADMTNLRAYHDRLANVPAIAAYYASASEDEVRWIFQPGALQQALDDESE